MKIIRRYRLASAIRNLKVPGRVAVVGAVLALPVLTCAAEVAFAAESGAAKSALLKSYIVQFAGAAGALDGAVQKCADLGAEIPAYQKSLAQVEATIDGFPKADKVTYLNGYEFGRDAAAKFAEATFMDAKSRVRAAANDSLSMSLADGKGKVACYNFISASEKQFNEQHRRFTDAELAYNLSRKK